MATIKTEYLLKLDEKEALLLSKALGSFNDDEFARVGIRDDDRRRLSEIFYLLPNDDAS